MRLGIGTAQFGFDYGITNHNGKVHTKEAHRIISKGLEYGIIDVDTAPSYGNAEEVLGKHSLIKNLKITTKTVLNEEKTHTKETVKHVLAGFRASLSKLKLNSLYGLLIHDTKDIKKPDFSRLAEALRNLKTDGLVSKIGISAYAEEEIAIADEYLTLDIIQIPINWCDQSLSNSTYIKSLSKRGVEIHARSIFLQGLLLEEPKQIPEPMLELKEKLQKLKKIALTNNLSMQDLAVKYVKQTEIADVAITGLCSDTQVGELIHSNNKHVPEIDWPEFRITTPEIIKPNLWGQRYSKLISKRDYRQKSL